MPQLHKVQDDLETEDDVENWIQDGFAGLEAYLAKQAAFVARFPDEGDA